MGVNVAHSIRHFSWKLQQEPGFFFYSVIVDNKYIFIDVETDLMRKDLEDFYTTHCSQVATGYISALHVANFLSRAVRMFSMHWLSVLL